MKTKLRYIAALVTTTAALATISSASSLHAIPKVTGFLPGR
ncbi:MAG TPA: hypothetical protein VKC60_17355 [Opitutaceae bacterium]|nr:hypothetical protein [Opitutaceae bacterium]